MQKYFPIASDTLRQEAFAAELSSVIQKWRKTLETAIADRIWLTIFFRSNEESFQCILHSSKLDSYEYDGTDSKVFNWSHEDHKFPDGLHEVAPSNSNKMWWLLTAAHYLTNKSNIYSVEVWCHDLLQGFEVTHDSKLKYKK
jgi:hypothetical protein